MVAAARDVHPYAARQRVATAAAIQRVIHSWIHMAFLKRVSCGFRTHSLFLVCAERTEREADGRARDTHPDGGSHGSDIDV